MAYHPRLHQYVTFHSDHYIDGALCWPIFMWVTSPTKPYLLLLLQQIFHKLLGIEDSIVGVIYVYHYSLTLILPLKGEFFLDSFSSVYIYLVLNAHITTDMFNKDTSSWELIRCIWFLFCVLDPTWIPRDTMICRQHMSRKMMIIIELLLLHGILIDCI